MEAADCLFGVTMQPGGTSRVLSERVRVEAPARS
jgi:chromosome segregation ATPase